MTTTPRLASSVGGFLAIIIGIVVVVCVTIIGATAVLVFAPDGTDIAPLIGLVAPTVAALGALAGVLRVAATAAETKVNVDQTNATVAELANGKMDAKIRAAVAEVLPNHMHDPEYDDTRKARDAAVVAQKLLKPHAD